MTRCRSSGSAGAGAAFMSQGGVSARRPVIRGEGRQSVRGARLGDGERSAPPKVAAPVRDAGCGVRFAPEGRLRDGQQGPVQVWPP